MVQVAIKPLTRNDINASILMCLRDARFKNFKDSILGMITASLYDGPVDRKSTRLNSSHLTASRKHMRTEALIPFRVSGLIAT